MANLINHKIGDTFLVHCTYKDAGGALVNLNEAEILISSAVRSGVQVFALEVIIPDQVENRGMFTIRGQTDEWPQGTLAWDIQYKQDGNTFSSETVNIRTIADVTP